MSEHKDSSEEKKEICVAIRKLRISDKKTGGPSTSKDESVENTERNFFIGLSGKSEEELKEKARALEPHMDEINKRLNDFANKEKSREILGAALLDDLKYHGMGLIKMLNITCQYFEKDWRVIRDWTLFTRTKLSWDRISEYILKYENPEKPQYSHPWARLIEPNAFASLASKENVFLCAIFGVVVAEVQGHQGIWQSIWAKKNEAQLDIPKRIGAAMIKKYGPKLKNKKKGRKY